MNFPVLTATGFFDDDQPGALRYYRDHVKNAPAAHQDLPQRRTRESISPAARGICSPIDRPMR